MRIYVFSMRTKIITSALLIIVLILLMGGITYLRSRQIIINAYEHTTQITMNDIAQYIDRVFQMVQGQALDITTTESLRDYASGFMKAPSEVRNFRRDYSNQLMQEMMNNEAIRRIIVITDHNEGFHADRLNPSETIFPAELCQQYLSSDEYAAVNMGTSGTWVGAHPYLDDEFSIGDSSYAISFARSIKDFRSTIGIAYIDISKSYIVSLLRKSSIPESSSMIFASADGIQTVYSGSGNSMSLTQTELDDIILTYSDTGYAYTCVSSERCLIAFSQSEISGVTVATIIPDKLITGQTASLRRIMLVCSAIAGVIGIFLIWGILGSLGKTVVMTGDVLSMALKGQSDARMKVGRMDEFGRISENINRIIDAVQLSSAKQREAEIRFLEAQLNPHFLYNTLDAISWTASDNHDRTVAEMLHELADILRYSITDSDITVPVSTEVIYLRKYLSLQQKRFHYSFDCTIDIDEKAVSCLVHKLLLQPLIENAVVHAFCGRDDGNELNVVIELRGADLYMSVRDNGIGMPAELVDAINKGSYHLWHNTHIGLRNTIMRLEMYYGEHCSISARSDAGGTVIDVTIDNIPVKEVTTQ